MSAPRIPLAFAVDDEVPELWRRRQAETSKRLGPLEPTLELVQHRAAALRAVLEAMAGVQRGTGGPKAAPALLLQILQALDLTLPAVLAEDLGQVPAVHGLACLSLAMKRSSGDGAAWLRRARRQAPEGGAFDLVAADLGDVWRAERRLLLQHADALAVAGSLTWVDLYVARLEAQRPGLGGKLAQARASCEELCLRVALAWPGGACEASRVGASLLYLALSEADVFQGELDDEAAEPPLEELRDDGAAPHAAGAPAAAETLDSAAFLAAVGEDPRAVRELAEALRPGLFGP